MYVCVCVCVCVCRYITNAFHEVHHVSKDKGVSLRTAAYIVALARIARADANRGHG